MNKKLFAVFFFFLLIVSVSWGYTSILGTRTRGPVLAIDTQGESGPLPKNFRRSDQSISQEANLSGLLELKAAGSGAFTEKQLVSVLREMGENVTVVDLRQESHGFLDGYPISWFAQYNWANLGKLVEVIEREEEELLRSIQKGRFTPLQQIVEKQQNSSVVKWELLWWKAEEVLSEKEVVERSRASYERFYVADHCIPSSEEVDRFIQLVAGLPEDSWIYVHCRGGRGRTTTFLLLYDILRNGKEVALEDLLYRQELLGGKNLFSLADQSSYKYLQARERAEFILRFYEFVREEGDPLTRSWSTWCQ